MLLISDYILNGYKGLVPIIDSSETRDSGCVYVYSNSGNPARRLRILHLHKVCIFSVRNLYCDFNNTT